MEELIPSKFYLSQNSPNPFKDNTKIKYCIPFKTKVCLTILSSTGVVIKELVNKIQEAGTYEIIFNRYNISVGDYFCQIQAGDPSIGTGKRFQQVRKMILLK